MATTRDPHLSLEGKTCLVTGATSGIGLATAAELARRGARVVVVGRDQPKAVETVARLQSETGNANIAYLLADLSIQAQVRQLGRSFRASYDRLDVLVNNAGAAYVRRQVSADGLEMTFALNHLAYFLLTNLLLDALKSSAPSRIINVSSGSHRNAQLDLNDLQMTRGYWVMKAYGRSKLANILFTYELARRLTGTGVTANAVHPGFVATNIGRNNGLLVRVLMSWIQRKALSPAEGAETVVYLATAPEMATVTGQYFIHKRAVRSSPESYNRDAARLLWEASSLLTGL